MGSFVRDKSSRTSLAYTMFSVLLLLRCHSNVSQFEFKMGTDKYSKKIFFNVKKNFQNKLRIISRKISENFENYFGKFGRIISRNSLEIIIEKYFQNYFGKFLEVFQKISENFQKYFWKFEEIITKFLRIVLKKVLKNFGKFRGLLRRILGLIS